MKGASTSDGEVSVHNKCKIDDNCNPRYHFERFVLEKLLSHQVDSPTSPRVLIKTNMKKHNEFTHIVVGAGSAGCIVAARIAENKKFNVLLIEAGWDCDPANSDAPAGIRDARRVPMKGQSDLFDKRIDWNVAVDLPDGNSMIVPQGRLVGGGSSINGGTALRSTKADSDEWVRLGNNAWDFDSIIQTYESMEDDALRGTKGRHPIVRTKIEDAGKIQRAFVDGAIECGFQPVADLNTTGAEGVGPSPVCRRGKLRISAANTYIDPIREQDNFTLWSEKPVERLALSGNKAIGVFLGDGQYVPASQEVVVSAGAIFTPALLQRSGVGETDLLRSLDIPQVAEVPVGRNMSDHPCIPIMARPLNGSYDKDDYSLQMQTRWSSSSSPGAIDLQMICFSYLYAQAPEPQVQLRGLSGTATGHVSGIGCNFNKPDSLGHVRIRSKSGSVRPIVTPGYLQTETDRSMAREVVRKGYEVFVSKPMQEVLEPPIGLTSQTVKFDDRLDQWISSQYSSTYHFCGTSRMASHDKGGVVDQSGRVYGVRGLRVCDASIIPTVPAANTMWTTMMFAERIASSIRDGRDVCSHTGPKL